MKKRVLAACAFAFVAACMKQPPPPDPAITAKRDVQLALERWQKAFEAKDVNGVMAVYAPGASLIAYDVVPPLQYKGLDAYRKDYGELFAQFDGPLHIDFRDTHLEAGNNLAVAYGLEHITGKLKTGRPVDIWVRYTSVFKHIDDRWLDIHDHVSVPADLDTGKAMLDLRP